MWDRGSTGSSVVLAFSYGPGFSWGLALAEEREWVSREWGWRNSELDSSHCYSCLKVIKFIWLWISMLHICQNLQRGYVCLILYYGSLDPKRAVSEAWLTKCFVSNEDVLTPLICQKIKVNLNSHDCFNCELAKKLQLPFKKNSVTQISFHTQCVRHKSASSQASDDLTDSRINWSY